MSHYVLMFKNNNTDNNKDGVEEYRKAVNMAKAGIEMVMDGMDEDSKQKITEGAGIAWDGMKKICELNDKMKEQFGERGGNNFSNRHDDFGTRDGYNNRGYNFREWSNDEDHMMERRMRDSMGRFK